MAIDPSQFHPNNVADTCAVWNVLSSQLLYAVARSSGCGFCLTSFVYYECLIKTRKKQDAVDQELQRRLIAAMEQKQIEQYSIDIADLQEVIVLENRKRVSKGELSSIAFAKKTRQAFLTDDQGARKLAELSMDGGMVQTTPHLFGWLFFEGKLMDADKRTVIDQHKEVGRPLEKHFDDMYGMALSFRLMAAPRMSGSD
jgi:hypothetical protein